MSDLDFLIAINFGQALFLVVVAFALLRFARIRSPSHPPTVAGGRYQLTVRHSMLLMAWVGIGLGAIRWLHTNFATTYSPGYREERFGWVCVGMTREQVVSIMGPPLRRDATSQRWSPLENWIYSEPPPRGTIADNYWRRWVMFDPGERGRVAAIVSDYYED